MEENKDMTPEQLFGELKARKGQSSHESLQEIYDAAITLGTTYKITGQRMALKKILYVLDTIEKEKTLVDLGINKFIYRDDIDFFIDNYTNRSRPVKILELSRYTRTIPPEIVEVVDKTKDIFDEFYVLFTDYTGKEEKRIEAEKRSTDPILFGIFIDPDARLCIDRFYYLGDWEDEMCDLTLDRMLSDPRFAKRNPIRYSATPATIEELKEYINLHKDNFDNNVSFTSYLVTPDIKLSGKKTFFAKVKSFLNKFV